MTWGTLAATFATGGALLVYYESEKERRQTQGAARARAVLRLPPGFRRPVLHPRRVRRDALRASLASHVRWCSARASSPVSCARRLPVRSPSALALSARPLTCAALASSRAPPTAAHLTVAKRVKTIGKPALGGPWTLVDAHGAPVTDADLRGSMMLLYFGFTHCPDICPSELVKMGEVRATASAVAPPLPLFHSPPRARAPPL